MKKTWIPLALRKPEDGQRVLICINDEHKNYEPEDVIEIAIYTDGEFDSDGDIYYTDDVSHWQPLVNP